jgi:hypothetical protein
MINYFREIKDESLYFEKIDLWNFVKVSTKTKRLINRIRDYCIRENKTVFEIF